jgi:hypothetical protein
MTTATYFAKSMVRKAREVNHVIRPQKRKLVDAIEFLVLMTLPFLLPFIVMALSVNFGDIHVDGYLCDFNIFNYRNINNVRSLVYKTRYSKENTTGCKSFT